MVEVPALSRRARSLAIVGAGLFLAGLLQGLAVDRFVNPRMALSAHLDAVQSGMAVMIAALFWVHAGLSGWAEPVARWTLAAGMTGLWIALTLAAATGASDSLPMAGAGHAGSAVAERTVTILIVTSSVGIVTGWSLLLWGLVRASR